MAFDLVMANAVETGQARLDMVNVSDAKALIGLMVYGSQQGLFVTALCRDVAVFINPGSQFPELVAVNDSGPVTLICARNDVFCWLGTQKRMSLEMQERFL